MTTMPPLDEYGEPDWDLQRLDARLVDESLAECRERNDLDMAGARCIRLCDDAHEAAVVALRRMAA